MPRQKLLQFLSSDQLKYLFPHEIISRLDYYVATIPVDLSTPALPPGGPDRQLDLLGEILDHIEPRLGVARVSETCVPLTRRQQDYLAHLILQARRKAYSLLESQADTPLGFHPDHRQMIANVLQGNWLDLTDGGRVKVEWEQLD